MSPNLGLALMINMIVILYIHNNNKELLVKHSNALPVVALASYYVASIVMMGSIHS